MRKTKVRAIGMLCAAVMTTQAEPFEVSFAPQHTGVQTVLGNPWTVTNSSDITASDSLATFRLSYDITASADVWLASQAPPAGMDGKWGIEGGLLNSQISDGQWATIDNIQVVDFNANGGDMTAGDISNVSFKVVYYADATTGGSSPDAGTIAANGTTNAWVDIDAGSQFTGHDPSGDGSVDLHLMTGSTQVDSFYIAGFSTNRSYRISNITVAGSFSDPVPVTSNYYVSTTGSDTDPGSLAQPFATIQHAVNVMLPGDTCFIRGGTYREAVDLSGVAGTSGKPITLTAYSDEEVILDGTIPISSSWTQHSGNIYKTTLSEDIWQLFVDGKMMTLARFPNALTFSDEMWDRHGARRYKKGSASSNGHVVDDPTKGAIDTVAGAGVSFNGCIGVFNFGNFSTSAGVLSNHTAGEDEFDFSPPVQTYKVNSSAYFLEGGVNDAELVMLDRTEEWAYDESTKTLYLWADDGLDPTGRNIKGKNQTYFFTGSPTTRSITFDGLDFFGTAFYFYQSDDITFLNCDLNYLSYSKRALGSTDHSAPAFFEGTTDDFCEQITVYNCEFNYTSGTALRGEKIDVGLVENNLFYQTSYASVRDANVITPSTITLLRSRDMVFRRNTVDTSGSGQTLKIGERDDRPWVSEYNYFTFCGLQQTDGAAHYSYQESAEQSVARYNWFYGNSARDFRWDGPNDPVVTGIHANIYRTVAMDTGIKEAGIQGDGYRLKGDFHEIYHNVGINGRSTLNVALDKGGNTNTVTRNNAADNFTDDPIPGTASNNFIGQHEPRTMLDLLRDPDNLDFRPRADAVELIDQGTPVTCSVNGQTIDVTAGYLGVAPDIGAYEYGASEYWIPGRQLPQASMPVPPSGNRSVKLDADLMWLGGLGATAYNVYFGNDPHSLAYQGNQTNNIFDPGPLDPDRVYYWRVDSAGPAGTVTGEVWTVDTSVPSTEIPAAEDTRCDGTSNVYGTDHPLRIQNYRGRRMYAKFHVSGIDAIASTALRLTVADGPIPDIDVYAVTGEWDELTLSGENDDLVWGELLDTQLNCAAGSTYEFDVSSWVTGDGTYTFGITTDANTNGLKISSRESITEAPTLIMTSVSGGPPADADADGLPDAWEMDYFGDLTTTDGYGDQDGDRFNDYGEFHAGTNPTNPASLFRVTGMDAADPTGMVITWDSVSNRVYGVHGSTNLIDGIFQPLETNIYYPQDRYTDTVFNAESAGFYRLDVRAE